MTKINLLELAKQVENTYEDVECSFGKIRVYHVPGVKILSAMPDEPEPRIPMVRMKLATGQFQERPIKQNDDGYEDWIRKRDKYDEEVTDLQVAARMVYALRDIEYPDLKIKPPNYVGRWPKNELLCKKLWLDYSVLASLEDNNLIMRSIMSMAGQELPTDEMVEGIKKNSE